MDLAERTRKRINRRLMVFLFILYTTIFQESAELVGRADSVAHFKRSSSDYSGYDGENTYGSRPKNPG